MRAASALEVRLWLVALACFVLFFVLGSLVSSRPPSRVDLAGAALRGELTPLASFFTALGRTFPVIAVAVFAAVVALAARANAWPVAAIFVSQLLSQGVVGFIKPIFHRMRPDHWLLYREKDLSFPSGHATTSIVFFAALALVAWRSPSLPRPLASTCAAAAAICVVGIPWSRLALGAHYVTDVTGGLLFGTGWLCVVVALALRFGAVAV